MRLASALHTLIRFLRLLVSLNSRSIFFSVVVVAMTRSRQSWHLPIGLGSSSLPTQPDFTVTAFTAVTRMSPTPTSNRICLVPVSWALIIHCFYIISTLNRTWHLEAFPCHASISISNQHRRRTRLISVIMLCRLHKIVRHGEIHKKSQQNFVWN